MIATQIIANSIIIGSIYALIACGFSLIYSTNKFMHLAHGITIVISSYSLFYFFSTLNIPLSISIIITLITAALFGLLINRLIYIPLQNKKSSNVILLIASVGILLLFQNLIQIIFGTNIKTLDKFTLGSNLTLFGAIITPLQIIIIIISIILLFILYFFMQKTKLGRNMRAISDNKELASIIGINHKKISDYSFIIGSLLAGVAGILVALEQNLYPSMGINLIIKGFTGAIIGGITSVPGSILGSYILGFAENFGILYLSSSYKEAISFVILFIFLLFKPYGIFGLNKGAKK